MLVCWVLKSVAGLVLQRCSALASPSNGLSTWGLLSKEALPFGKMLLFAFATKLVKSHFVGQEFNILICVVVVTYKPG